MSLVAVADSHAFGMGMCDRGHVSWVDLGSEEKGSSKMCLKHKWLSHEGGPQQQQAMNLKRHRSVSLRRSGPLRKINGWPISKIM